MHHSQEEEAQSRALTAVKNADAERLGALENADPTLTPLLASIVSRFMRSEPLPTR